MSWQEGDDIEEHPYVKWLEKQVEDAEKKLREVEQKLRKLLEDLEVKS